MATKKATAPTFSGPPTSYTGYNPSQPKVVVVTAAPRPSGGYGVTPTYGSTVPPMSYSGGATPVAPAKTTVPSGPPMPGSFSSPVGSTYVSPTYAPPVTTGSSMSPANRAEASGAPGTPPPAFGGPPLAYSQPGGADSGINPFSEEGMSGLMYNPALGAGKVYAAQSTNIPVNTAPTPVIVNGAVDYNNMVPTTPSNQDITRVESAGGYAGPIVGFNPDGTPIRAEADWYSTYGSSAPQGTTGILPPLAYSTPTGTTVTPWEKTKEDWRGITPLEVPEPPGSTSGGGGGGGYGWGGGGDYGNYATSMGLFNWRIGL